MPETRLSEAAGSYKVRVYENLGEGQLVGVKDFAYGDFQRIGYWLDEKFFIDPAYKVVIRFLDH